MSSLNQSTEPRSERLLENMRDIPFSIHEHLLGHDTILRPKQREAITSTSNVVFEGNRAVAMIMPTGTGKTVISAGMLHGLKQDEQTGHTAKRTLFISDSIEGILQTKDKMKIYADIDVGAYYQDEKNIDGQVIATTYQSWQRDGFPIDPETIDLIILDESHRAISEARIKTLKQYKNAVWLFLTASPDYDEQRSVLNFAELGFRMNIREAVQHQLISGFRNIVLNSDIEIDLDEIGLSNKGDYNEKDLTKALNTEARNRIGADYLLFGSHPDTGQPIKDIRGIISCSNINHANDVAEQINKLYEEYYPGKAPEHGFIRSISGATKNRKEILDWHKEGKIAYLAFADLLNQNYDDKGIGICLNMRLSQSTVVVTQRGGRAERLDEKNPEKIALIVDLLDKYKGETRRQPLLYAHAIGEVSVITDEISRIAKREKFERSKNSSLHQSKDFSDEMRELARLIELKIVTNEQSILSIKKEDAIDNTPIQTQNDLTVSDIVSEFGIPQGSVNRNFLRIKDEWDKYNLDSEKNVLPDIAIYKVKPPRGFASDAISRDDFPKLKEKYFSDFFLPLRTEDDISILEIQDMTKLSSKLIQNRLENILEDQKKYIEDPENNQNPLINVYRVKSSNGSAGFAIHSSELSTFKEVYLADDLIPKKSDGDLVSAEIGKLVQCSKETIATKINQLKSDWIEYKVNPKINKMPALETYKTKSGGNATDTINVKDFEKFKTDYLSDLIALKKTPNDLNGADLAIITGYSKNLFWHIFDDLKNEWNNYKEFPNQFKKPEINIYKVKVSKGPIADAIAVGDLDLLKKKYLQKYEIKEKEPTDLSVKDISKLIGIDSTTLLSRFRDNKKLWEKFEQDPNSSPKPNYKTYEIKGENNRSAAAIHINELQFLIEEHNITAHKKISYKNITIEKSNTLEN